MHANQLVADMVEEVLARQAAVRARWSRESFGDALGAVVLTKAGRQLQELHDGPHSSERACEWQENLVRSRAEARVALTTDTSFLEKHLISTAGFQQTEDGLLAERNRRFADQWDLSMELVRTFSLGSVFGMEEFFNSLTSTLGIPVNKENPPPTEVLLPWPSSWLEPKVVPRYHEPWKSS